MMAKCFFFSLVFLSVFAHAKENFSLTKIEGLFSLPQTEQRRLAKIIEKGEIITEAKVSDTLEKEKKMQSLVFSITGLHPRPCSEALPKLSHFEAYPSKINFVKEARYDEKSEIVWFFLDSKLLPSSMTLSFKIPRIKEAGIYPFTFDHGIFSGLKGEIKAFHFQKKCLIHSQANWQGKHTGFSNFIVELFSENLSKLSMEVMFRLTK